MSCIFHHASVLPVLPASLISRPLRSGEISFIILLMISDEFLFSRISTHAPADCQILFRLSDLPDQVLLIHAFQTAPRSVL